MKAVTLLLLLTSAASFACPNLSGTYHSCTTGNQMLDMEMKIEPKVTITQTTLEDGTTIYTTDDGESKETYVTGETATRLEPIDEEDPDMVDVLLLTRTLTSCQANSLEINIKADVVRATGSTMPDDEFEILRELMGAVLGNTNASTTINQNGELVTTINMVGETITTTCIKE